MDKSTPRRRKTEPRNSRSYRSSKRSSTKIASASSCSNRFSSRTNHTHLAEVSADGPEKCIDRSSETRSRSSPSAASPERARTSSRQQCCSTTCLIPRTPRRGEFKTRCRLCSKWRQFSRPRAQPLDVEEQRRKSVRSQPRTKKEVSVHQQPPLEGKDSACPQPPRRQSTAT